MTEQQRRTYHQGERVKVVVYGEVVVHDGGEICLAIDGIAGNLYQLPLVDDQSEPLRDVIAIAAPQVKPGDVWHSRPRGWLYLATAVNGRVYLVDPENRAHDPVDVAERYGPLDLVLTERLGADSADQRPVLFDLPRPEIAPDPDHIPEQPLPVYESTKTGPLGPANPNEPFDAFAAANKGPRAIEPPPPGPDATTVMPAAVGVEVPVMAGHPGPPESPEADR